MRSGPRIPTVALILWTGSALADTPTRAVNATRDMPAAPEKVLDAFLNDGDLKAWWKVSRSLVERKPGGVWSVAWDDWGPEKTHHAWVGVIEQITADSIVVGHMVMLEPDMPLFGPMQLEIRVEPTAEGSTVSVSHRGYGHGEHWDAIYQNVVDGWDHVLGDMQAWWLASSSTATRRARPAAGRR